MSAWSSRRKSLFALIVIMALAILIGVPAFQLFYEAPACNDNKKNGDEQGIDCGGSCTKLCSNAFLDIPSPAWVRFKETAPNIYNAAAYIINPNPKAEIKRLPYKLVLFDKNATEIAVRSGVFNLSAGRNTLVFVGGISVKNYVPVRAVLEFDKTPEWMSATDRLTGLNITGKKYDEDDLGSSADITLENRSAAPLRDIAVYAILKDADDNVLDFSKTVVDEIAPQASALAPFTWPSSHGGRVISLEVLAVPE